MAWDPVPWFIGGDESGGAEHSPEITRMIAYQIMGGQQGVLSRLDLRVLPLETPGTGYRVMPGASSILSAWQPLQAYLNRMPNATSEPGGPKTPTTGGRSDLVVANILDPFSPGSPWDPPANRGNGPYIETTLITDVPPATTTFEELGISSWSAMELARIDMPANTETIEASYIQDLRTVANPLTGIEQRLDELSNKPSPSKVQTYVRSSGSQTTDTLTLSNANNVYTDWPDAANVSVAIPKWATHVTYNVQITNIRIGSATTYQGAFGEARMRLGSITTTQDNFDFDGAETIHSNETIYVLGEMEIPESMRGTVVTAQTQGMLYDAYHPEAVLLAGDDRTKTWFNFNFRQGPIY